MAILEKVSRCYHCGTILQTEDENKQGYISPTILEKYPQGLLLCNNCFMNQRYSNVPREIDFEEGFEKILDKIRETKAFVVYVVDLFSFEGSFIAKLNEKLKGLDVLAVANKLDLMPKEADESHLIEYVAHRLRVTDLNVNDVCLVSSNKGFNIDLMYQKIVNLSKGRDVYFLGASVSGKSSLITELLKFYQNNTNHYIVTYTFEGTNLRGFQIPLTNKSYIYEVPGTSIENSILSKVERSVQNEITPKKQIKMRKMSISKENSITLGTLGAIELLSDTKVELKMFFSDKITFKKKKAPAHKLLEKLLAKPGDYIYSQNINKISDFDAFDIEVTENDNRDIGILGLGWFSFKGNNQKFRIYVPKGVYVFTTRSKI